MKHLKNTLTSVGVSTALVATFALPQTAIGSGFQISETSVSGLGRSFAGNGVSHETISDMFANPASLSFRKGTEVEFGAHLIDTNADFVNQGSTLTFAGPGGGTVPASGPNSNGGGSAVVPNIFVATDINDNMRLGLGITSPFGLKTEYDENWVGRYAAIESELITIEVNPTLSYDFGATAIGVGLTFLHGDATLTNAQFTGAGSPDTLVRLSGSDTGVGYTLGIVGENEYGTVGVGYRSRIKLDVDGVATVGPGTPSFGARTEITLPETWYISGLWKINEKLDLLGTLRTTNWESFQELRIDFDNGLPPSITPENWDVTTTSSIGFNYRANENWTYRGGLGYDQSAVDNVDRTARIPDDHRWWLSLGGSYHKNDRVRIDFGYARLIVDNAPINESTNLVSTAPGAATSNLRGDFKDTDANLFSIGVAIKTGGGN